MATTPVPLKEPLDYQGSIFVTNGVWQRWLQAVPDATLMLDGWTRLSDKLVSITADAPSYTVVVSGDQSGKYHPGMKIRITQGTVKYFIVTQVTYSQPNTSLVLYGGTDYALTTSISMVTEAHGSIFRSPLGFPLNPSKWSVRVVDTANRIQSTPTEAVWYNIGGSNCQISIPIGVWSVGYSVTVYLEVGSATTMDMWTTLSTANNSQSDAGYTAGFFSSTPINMANQLSRCKILDITTKTTYYLNAITYFASTTAMHYIAASRGSTVIEAVSSYL